MKFTYDITESYRTNFESGPMFANDPPRVPETPIKTFLGLPVASRFGIAAGLLLNSSWILGYARRGFDLLTYKTVRSRARECYPPPNWVFVEAEEGDAPVWVKDGPGEDARTVSSAVCFGMPSMSPEMWRADVAKAKAGLGTRQVLIVSVVASPDDGDKEEEVAADFAQCAAWAAEAGADVVEANFSCPNVCSAEGSVYLDAGLSGRIAERIRDAVGKTPILIKSGHFTDDAAMEVFLSEVAESANGVVLVNGIAREVRHRDGRPAFGNNFVRAGVLGRVIHAPSVASMRRASKFIKTEGLPLDLIGVGGAAMAEDVEEFMDAGAAAVMLGSSPMYLPDLAVEIKKKHPDW